MKTLIIAVLAMSVCLAAYAKTYEVTVNDKYVPYIEKYIGDTDKEVAAWLAAQAVNEAERNLNEAYDATIVEKKTYDEKKSELESE